MPPKNQTVIYSEFIRCDDLLPQIISQKLQPQGYRSYWYGKGHTGYKSMAHLPINRGFDDHIGYLTGMQSYTSPVRWQQERPLNTREYSTHLFGDAAVGALEAHNASEPFFMYLPWQAVHDPYDDVPGWPYNDGNWELNATGTYRGMLWLTDVYVGKLVELLHKKGMWDNTLIVFASDNGGRGAGVNYPYRGEKRTNYEGGMRVPAFVSGGLLPSAVRGTTSDVRMHIVDWYPTFCRLAGVDPSDDSPVPPLPVPPSDPTPVDAPFHDSCTFCGCDWKATTDIYGNESWPGVDGVDVWDMIVKPSQYHQYSAHHTIALSHEVLLKGKYKLMVSQRGNTHQDYDEFEAGWRHPNLTWVQPSNRTCGVVNGNWTNTKGHFIPCLFDLEADPREEVDLSAAMPKLRDLMYKQLNDTWRTFYVARSPPELLGHCDSECADKKWVSMRGRKKSGPVCGVPGCSKLQKERPWAIF
ncbi:hypothetical protein CYMTET_11595 [Cymbomonas tetramitiformis]|uniref:Sulfatase N-terminal domain-containing protein n=1 Tax=Cymbomonas tetramitiformis TaxID=36881 RepID=A0AAE0GLR7_9CHLO|nr:hypothetical protein CYMTET_11595 [Cymbomonas tetramitiformis]